MSVVSSSGPVEWRVDGRGVATIALNRPNVGNAYDGELIQGMREAVDAMAKVVDLRVIVLRGNGRHFQAGADLKWIDAVRRSSPEANLAASHATADLVRRLDHAAVPTVALVQGGCFGGGTGVIAACDVVIAADSALFAISETRWGLTAAIILPQLVRAIGLRQLRRYALTCERFGAEEARRIGLVHEVVAAADLEAAGARVVAQLLENGPAAIKESKALALGLADAPMDAALFARLVERHAAVRQSAEAAEGLASFAERRPANWQPNG